MCVGVCARVCVCFGDSVYVYMFCWWFAASLPVSPENQHQKDVVRASVDFAQPHLQNFRLVLDRARKPFTSLDWLIRLQLHAKNLQPCEHPIPEVRGLYPKSLNSSIWMFM